MKIASWFRNGRPRPRGRAVRRPARLALEALEQRCVLSTIQGTVLDSTANAGLAGWTVWLDVNNDHVVSPGEPVATTDAGGNYFFDTTNVPPNLTASGESYDAVNLDLQVGTGGRWINTTQTDAVVDRTATPDATGVNFGVRFQPAVGVGPLGPESLVNATTAGQQGNTTYKGAGGGLRTAVAADAAGNYVVAWRTFVPGGTDVISARVFNADGSARTGDITVATQPNTASYVGMPEVAMAGNGRFMVDWGGFDAAGVGQSVHAQVYQANGQAVGGPITVLAGNASTTGGLGGIGADATGNFVVAYNVETKLHGGGGWSGPTVKAQRYTASGSANGNAVTVATPGLVNGIQSVAMDGAGNFVVVWDDSGSSVLAQRFKATGQKNGSVMTVASETGVAWQSDVAMNPAGQFAVTWFSRTAGQRMVQRYNADGTRSGGAVGFTAREEQGGVALDGAGNLTFVWTGPWGNTLFGQPEQVRMRRLTGAGVLEPETIANTTLQGTHFAPGVAATGSGTSVVVWQGHGASDPGDITSQRYAPLDSAAGGAATATGATPALTPQAVQPLVAAAIARWARAGASAAQLAALRAVQVQVADLAGAELGQAAGRTIWIDRDAAGYGWFVDATPNDDAEFRTAGDWGQRGHMDLLTVLCHEMGHVLGLGHSLAADDVMAEALATGVRHMPIAGDLAAAGAWEAAFAALVRRTGTGGRAAEGEAS
jgi:hypothetical protein